MQGCESRSTITAQKPFRSAENYGRTVLLPPNCLVRKETALWSD
jgi:hypothetical protein